MLQYSLFFLEAVVLAFKTSGGSKLMMLQPFQWHLFVASGLYFPKFGYCIVGLLGSERQGVASEFLLRWRPVMTKMPGTLCQMYWFIPLTNVPLTPYLSQTGLWCKAFVQRAWSYSTAHSLAGCLKFFMFISALVIIYFVCLLHENRLLLGSTMLFYLLDALDLNWTDTCVWWGQLQQFSSGRNERAIWLLFFVFQ